MSRSKSRVLLVVSIAVIAAAAGVFLRTRPVEAPQSTSAAVATATRSPNPTPVREVRAPAPQPIVTQGFVIRVESHSASVNGTSIVLHVTNDSDMPLSLQPDTQFVLVGVKDGAKHMPLPEETSAGFAQELAPSAEAKGTLVFDSFVGQSSELRFYPDPHADTYITVPMITYNPVESR